MNGVQPILPKTKHFTPTLSIRTNQNLTSPKRESPIINMPLTNHFPVTITFIKKNINHSIYMNGVLEKLEQN